MATVQCGGGIGDYVWHDLNHNGIQDDGDAGINGVTVNLEDANGTVVDTTTTSTGGPNNKPGYYQFTSLCPGSYTVLVDSTSSSLAGLSPTINRSANGDDLVPNDSNEPAGTSVTLTAGDSSNQTVDFGYVSPCTGAIGDYVWNDLNRDGLQNDGDTGINGVTVQLEDASGNVIDSVTTFTGGPNNKPGYYQFTGLCAGDYMVAVDSSSAPLTALTPTINRSTNGNDGKGTDSNEPTGTSVTLTTDDSTNETVDFGYFAPCTAAIGDYVWNDLNRNGIQDDGTGAGINNVKVILKDANGNVIATTTTFTGGPANQAGYYQFSGLCAGSYIVAIDSSSPSLAGLTPTINLSSNGDDLVGNDSNQPAGTTVTLGDYTSNQTVDFGYVSECGLTVQKTCLVLPQEQKGSWCDHDKHVKTGSRFTSNCPSSPPTGSDACSFVAPAPPSCQTVGGKLESLTFKYTGADCSASNNNQNSRKWYCEGTTGTDPVITVVQDPRRIRVSPASGIKSGDLITITGNRCGMGSEIDLLVGDQSLKINTSCSQPLAVGDVFGSLELLKINGQGAGTEVRYSYKITNTSNFPVSISSVLDDKLGELKGLLNTPDLAPGQSETITKSAYITQTTTNNVTVKTDQHCSAHDAVTVTVQQPPPSCDIKSAGFKVDCNKIEWKLWNGNSQSVTLDNIAIGWPSKLGALKKIKAGDATIWQGDRKPTSTDFVSTDFINGSDKLQIKPGQSLMLVFEFANPAKTGADDFTIHASFAGGCSISFRPNRDGYDCHTWKHHSSGNCDTSKYGSGWGNHTQNPFTYQHTWKRHSSRNCDTSKYDSGWGNHTQNYFTYRH